MQISEFAIFWQEISENLCPKRKFLGCKVRGYDADYSGRRLATLNILLPFQRKGYIYGLRDGTAFLSIFGLCRSRKLFITISTPIFNLL